MHTIPYYCTVRSTRIVREYMTHEGTIVEQAKDRTRQLLETTLRSGSLPVLLLGEIRRMEPTILMLFPFVQMDTRRHVSDA